MPFLRVSSRFTLCGWASVAPRCHHALELSQVKASQCSISPCSPLGSLSSSSPSPEARGDLAGSLQAVPRLPRTAGLPGNRLTGRSSPSGVRGRRKGRGISGSKPPLGEGGPLRPPRLARSGGDDGGRGPDPHPWVSLARSPPPPRVRLLGAFGVLLAAEPGGRSPEIRRPWVHPGQSASRPGCSKDQRQPQSPRTQHAR